MADSKNAPLSRADVVSEVSAQMGMPATQVDQVIRAFEGSLIRTLASGGEVRMLGLGSFKVSERAARKGRNPKTGESIKIAASKNVRFSAGRSENGHADRFWSLGLAVHAASKPVLAGPSASLA